MHGQRRSRRFVEELVGSGAARPSLDAEIADPETGRPLAVAEAFWPNGLQPVKGRPSSWSLIRTRRTCIGSLSSATRSSPLWMRCVAMSSGATRLLQESARTPARCPQRAGVRAVEGDTTLAADPRLVPGQRSGAPDKGESSFEQAVRETVRRSQDELGYNPRYFVSMIAQHGAVGAARRLLGAPTRE
jgi:hypothetical protein